MHGRISNGRGDSDELLTTTEVARRFHVSPKTVRRWALAGKVNALMTPGGQRRFSAKEIDALLRAAEEPDVTAGVASSAPASGSPWLPAAPLRQDSNSV
jgi:excisionase family DNA binding protein